jgi:hypothetical protein
MVSAATRRKEGRKEEKEGSGRVRGKGPRISPLGRPHPLRLARARVWIYSGRAPWISARSSLPACYCKRFIE